MYESLKAHSNDFHLFIFAFDDLSFQILKKLNLEKVTVISLSEFETPVLLELKSKRTKAEYCWTCTPSVISHILNNYSVSSCTYLDSDLIFYSDPSVLIQEMMDHNKNVLITEHGFSPLAKLYEKKRAGRFCVQFVTFSNESNSLRVLEKWRLQCIEWCYARHENGKFGDQKYLDEWPDIYDNVHILENPGGGIAPWNIPKYRFYRDDSEIAGKRKRSGLKFKVVFFHFQYVKLTENGNFDIGWYHISSEVKKIFYQPYLKRIRDMEKMLKELDGNFKTGYTKFKADSIKSYFKIGLKKITRYNIMKIN
ncbi:MAG: glycosyl transferase [Bacteroidales bacterium]|nr:glycosyl transferase [Bacteroidales bacterium]